MAMVLILVLGPMTVAVTMVVPSAILVIGVSMWFVVVVVDVIVAMD